jgi:transcriptional regulator with XRE-family HTH domain
MYDYVMAQFDARRITQRQVADDSGVPFSTVCKIAQRSVKEPSVHTIQRLFDYFKSDPSPRCACVACKPEALACTSPTHHHNQEAA